MTKIHIISLGLGNIGSVENMFKRLGVETVLCSTPDQLKDAEKIVLPGVGSFDHGMASLMNLGLQKALVEKVLIEKKKILGICLGMQLLTLDSEEGSLKGLGLVNAKTKKFISTPSIKVPHMGWNGISIVKESSLTLSLPKDTRFYFVHSYYVECLDPRDVLIKAHHGRDFDAAFEHENIFGVQFHPEKSHRYGMQFLEEFSKL